MALFPKNKPREDLKDRLVYANTNSVDSITGFEFVSEALKGVVQNTKIKFPKELGEEHPFNYEIIDRLMKKFGLAAAIVDKHVDFVLSGGIAIKSEDSRAQTIIEEFMREYDFLNVVRVWLRQAMRKGFSPLEIGGGDDIEGMKVLKANCVYVERDELGVVKGYNQHLRPLNKFSAKEIEHFEEGEIAALNINVDDDAFYGMGYIWQLLLLINDLIGSRKEMHTLMKRKANSPFIMIMGDKEKGDYPTAAEMEDLGGKLEWLTNKHEWVLTDYVKPMTLDFGSIGDKFQFIVENNIDLLYGAAQIPSVLMGRGSIPEGLAEVQMRAFELRIQSIREETEKVIEEKIFKRVLASHGIDSHVEVIWGLPSQKEKNEKIRILTELLKNPFIGDNFKYQLELQVAGLLDIAEEEIETPEEERAKEEEEEQQPIVPEERKREPTANPPKIPTTASIITEKDHSGLTVQEWVGFNYKKYNQDVIDVTNEDLFMFLKANTKSEIEGGLLKASDIAKLKMTMVEGFEKNLTIREMQNLLNKRINFKDRLRMKDGKFILSKEGKRLIALRSSMRAIAIARTETVRLSNLGAIKHFKKEGIERVRWISSVSDRTCETCASLNGEVFDINAVSLPPLHTMCRCTTASVER